MCVKRREKLLTQVHKWPQQLIRECACAGCSTLDTCSEHDLIYAPLVSPHTGTAIGVVTCFEALADPYQQRPNGHLAVTLGPIWPLIEPASGYTERLAHPSYRPDAAVTCDEGVLHWDSFAKYASLGNAGAHQPHCFKLNQRQTTNVRKLSGVIALAVPAQGLPLPHPWSGGFDRAAHKTRVLCPRKSPRC